MTPESQLTDTAPNPLLTDTPAPPPSDFNETDTPGATQQTADATAGQTESVEEKTATDAASENGETKTDSVTEGDKEAAASEPQRLGRKMWAAFKDKGGEEAFEVATRLLDNYLITPNPEQFVQDLASYPVAFEPVRDRIITEEVRLYPEQVMETLRKAHPEMFAGQSPQPASPQAAQAQGQESAEFDPVEYANNLLNDAYATEADKAAARHMLQAHEQMQKTQEQLGKIPKLEEKVNAFDKLTAEQRAAEVEKVQGKYFEDVMTVVDRIHKESGLETAGVSAQRFRNFVRAEYAADPQRSALVDEVIDLIGRGDIRTATLKQRPIMARAEAVAAEIAASLTKPKAQTATAGGKTPPPPPLAGDASALSTERAKAPAWDEATIDAGWDDIKQRVK
jgi:hypothetical protein